MNSSVEKIWLLDIGNTRCKCARLQENGERGDVSAFAHRDGADISRLLKTLGNTNVGDIVWLASVAPGAYREAIVAALLAQDHVVERVRTVSRCRRLRIAYSKPESLGVDRFLSLLAASERKEGAYMLVSVGSAVTIDLLAPDGQHLGGVIAPSAEHQRDALAKHFSQLDVIAGKATDFADDTADAIASGTQGAVLGLIERSRRLAEARLGVSPRVILSGGGADTLVPRLPFAVELAPWLVLDGLAVFARHQKVA